MIGNLLKTAPANLLRRMRTAAAETDRQQRLQTYLKSDRHPWSTGYNDYKMDYLDRAINDTTLLTTFRRGDSLPKDYGFRLDSRVVEIPWLLSRLPQAPDNLLDAGSSLNHEAILKTPIIAGRKLVILTLAPEKSCFWKLGVSYMFGDLRDMLFRDGCFDSVASISTLEHVGMDNAMYAGQLDLAKKSHSRDFLVALKELKRVLKPGGTLYITLPFGRYEDHGWLQQFDAPMIDLLVETIAPTNVQETIFRFTPEGWTLSNRAECVDCQYFDVHTSKYFDATSTIEYPADYPAAERAVICLELRC